jgi:hypothetical protein
MCDGTISSGIFPRYPPERLPKELHGVVVLANGITQELMDVDGQMRGRFGHITGLAPSNALLEVSDKVDVSDESIEQYRLR